MRALVVLMLAATLIGGCRSSQPTPNPFDLTETTLRRYDGGVVALEDIALHRGVAEMVADTVYRLEKELREPWQEQRTGEELLRAVRLQFPSETRTAERAWQNAEPTALGRSRAHFTEFGIYPSADSPAGMTPPFSPSTVEALANLMLRGHDDENPEGLLLATWRRFSPATSVRRPRMLAAAWQFDLDYAGEPAVLLSESMFGPHNRSRLGRVPGNPFPPLQESAQGYTGNLIALDLLLPGPPSPVLEAIDTLAAGGIVRLAPGPAEVPRADDLEFLGAVMRGLRGGAAELTHIPAGTRRVTALFSYLVDRAEARALLQFDRDGAAWTLTRFEYQPAAASLTGNDGATVDLMPLLRGATTRR